ncbi:MAG TPA: YqiA/YcfP family alpha/beta fold hydrolase, partial [Ottowia sp.]|nr:YqiA/YcfP family alpha/beta fold hydrolase [Ottowia sp.]
RTGPLPAPERCLAVIAQGDELLDWREMAARYAGARQIVLAGGDHALSDFEAHVDAVLDFLDLS